MRGFFFFTIVNEKFEEKKPKLASVHKQLMIKQDLADRKFHRTVDTQKQTLTSKIHTQGSS